MLHYNFLYKYTRVHIIIEMFSIILIRRVIWELFENNFGGSLTFSYNNCYEKLLGEFDGNTYFTNLSIRWK